MAEQLSDDSTDNFSEGEEALFVAEEDTASENEVTALRTSQDFGLGNVAIFRSFEDGTKRGLVGVRIIYV